MSVQNKVAGGTVPVTGVVSLLIDVLRKVEASVGVKIQDHVAVSDDRTSYHAPTDGIDFLDTKNTLLLSYMIDLVVHLRNYFITLKEQNEHEDEDDDDEAATTTPSQLLSERIRKNNETRLMEMKVLLDKISSGLDRKLRYQIDKVLLFASSATTTSDSSAFATRTDPLQYRPGIVPQHPKGNTTLSEDNDDDDDDDGDENDVNDIDNHDSDHDDDMDEDDDYRAARQTIRMAAVTGTKPSKQSSINPNDEDSNNPNDDTNGGNTIYRAPRFMSTPYPNESRNYNTNELRQGEDDDGDDDGYDNDTKQQQKEERYKQKLRNSEIVQTLREQLNDHRPEQDDIVGTGTGGSNHMNHINGTTMMQNREQYKFLQLQKEKLQFEEDYMIRLPRSKTERKQEQLFQRQREQNTISSITKDLHQIVRTNHTTGSTGTLSTRPSKYDARSSSQRSSSQDPSDAKRKSVPKNSLQAALFGGDSSHKKKKKR